MSALTKTLHPDEKYKAGKLGGSLTKAGLGIFLVFMVISLVLGSTHGDHMKRFLYAYVIGWTYIFSLSLGAMWLVLLHHLVRGRWATVVRRVAEAMTGAFPLIFVAGLGFVIPLMFVLGAIFALLWGTAYFLGRKIERERAEAYAAYRAEQQG